MALSHLHQCRGTGVSLLLLPLSVVSPFLILTSTFTSSFYIYEPLVKEPFMTRASCPVSIMAADLPQELVVLQHREHTTSGQL